MFFAEPGFVLPRHPSSFGLATKWLGFRLVAVLAAALVRLANPPASVLPFLWAVNSGSASRSKYPRASKKGMHAWFCFESATERQRESKERERERDVMRQTLLRNTVALLKSAVYLPECQFLKQFAGLLKFRRLLDSCQTRTAQDFAGKRSLIASGSLCQYSEAALSWESFRINALKLTRKVTQRISYQFGTGDHGLP